jgi:hypothetical protein
MAEPGSRRIFSRNWAAARSSRPLQMRKSGVDARHLMARIHPEYLVELR